MSKITNITARRYNKYSDTYIMVEVDIDKGDSIAYHLQSSNIEQVRETAEWLKSYCHSKQSIETIAVYLFKALLHCNLTDK